MKANEQENLEQENLEQENLEQVRERVDRLVSKKEYLENELREVEFKLNKCEQDRKQLKEKITKVFGDLSDDELQQKYNEIAKELNSIEDEIEDILNSEDN